MSGDDLEAVGYTLSVIRNYCERIAIHMHRFGGRDEFLRDWAYQDSCIMVLGQIGEETKKILDWLQSNSGYNWKDVARFRDFIYHCYSRTNYDLVWKIIEDDVPDLIDEVDRLLKSIGPLS